MARAEGDLARAVRVGEWDQGFGWDFLGSTLMIGIERVACMGVVHMWRLVLDVGETGGDISIKVARSKLAGVC